MVACDVRVHVEPDPLDAIVIGTVGRKEMQDDAIAERFEDASRRVTLVDAVVVEHEMNAPRAAITTSEMKEQLAEEFARLRVVADDVKAPSDHVERAGEIVFLIFAGRHDAPLLTAEHPVATDLRIQMDVDFVDVEHGLALRRVLFETTNLAQNTLLSLARPRTQYDRLRRTEPRAELMQRATHRTDGDAFESFALERETQKLARPRRSLPAEIARTSHQRSFEREKKLDRDLPSAVVATTIVERLGAAIDEARLCPRHVRDSDSEQTRDLDDTSIAAEQRNDLKTLGRRDVATFSSFTQQSTPLRARHSGYLRAHGASLGV